MKELIATLVLMTATWNTISAQHNSNSVPSTDREKPWNEFVWLDVGDGRIGGRAYINADLADEPVLVVPRRQVCDAIDFEIVSRLPCGTQKDSSIGARGLVWRPSCGPLA